MYETRKVSVGRLVMGGHNPVWVQSMTNTDTRDVEKTLAQIRALHAAGCDLVRVSVYDVACAKAVRDLVDGSPCPLVADIQNKKECGGNRQWQRQFLRKWAANTKGKAII